MITCEACLLTSKCFWNVYGLVAIQPSLITILELSSHNYRPDPDKHVIDPVYSVRIYNRALKM